MKNPFKRKPKVTPDPQAQAAPPTADDVLDMAKYELARATRQQAVAMHRVTEAQNRRAGATSKAYTLLTIIFIVITGAQLYFLGQSVERGDGKGIFMDSFFLLAFGLLMAGRLLDLVVEAKKGAAIRNQYEEEQAAEREVKRNEKLTREIKAEVVQAVNEALDEAEEEIDDAPDPIKEVHAMLLTKMLSKITKEVLGDDKVQENDITQPQLDKVARLFKERTGHTANLKKVPGKGILVHINTDHKDTADHTDELQNPSPAKKAAAKRGNEARRKSKQ